MTTGALDPTAVVLGPRPVQASDAEETKVIVGEVLGGRHRAPRLRRVGTGPVGAVVLSATGLVAGLSLLLHHESATGTAVAAREPAASAPDQAPPEAAAAAPIAATAAVPAGEGELEPAAPAAAKPAAPAPAAPVRRTHPGRGHSMSFEQWLKSLRDAAAADRSGTAPGPDSSRYPGYGDPRPGGGPGMGPGGPYSEADGGN